MDAPKRAKKIRESPEYYSLLSSLEKPGLNPLDPCKPNLCPADLLVHALLRLEPEAWNNYRMEYKGTENENPFLASDDPEIARLEREFQAEEQEAEEGSISW